jgi:O-antigen ligase
MMEMALGLTLGIAIMRGVKGRRLAVYLIAAALMWLAVIRVNSRGGLLSMLCQVVILGVLLVARRTKKELVESGRASAIKQRVLQVILVVMLLIGSVVTVIFVGGDPLATRIDSLSVELNQKTAQTYALRQNIWQATWALIKDHPIGGAGFGGYWMAIRKYHRASGETTPQQAHNDYLELLASGGVIALGIGIWFVVVFVKLARTALNNADELGTAVITGASIGIVTVLVHSLVDFGLHVTVNALVFTTLIALVAIVERRGRKPLQT